MGVVVGWGGQEGKGSLHLSEENVDCGGEEDGTDCNEDCGLLVL